MLLTIVNNNYFNIIVSFLSEVLFLLFLLLFCRKITSLNETLPRNSVPMMNTGEKA